MAAAVTALVTLRLLRLAPPVPGRAWSSDSDRLGRDRDEMGGGHANSSRREQLMEAMRTRTDSKIEFGSMRRSDDFIRNIFLQFASAQEKLSKGDVLKALGALGLRVPDDDFETMFMEMDTTGDGFIDMEEFIAAVKLPSAVEVWAKGISWWQPVADAIPLQSGVDPLRSIAKLSNLDVDVICESVILAFKGMLLEEVRRLKDAFEKMDFKSAESDGRAAIKFKTFKASCGKVLDFHEGLKGRVGHIP